MVGFDILRLIGTFTSLVVLVLAIVMFVRAMSRSNSSQRGPAAQAQPSPLEILERRYARGEITQEQFLQMKKDLKQD